jgi:two-component system chemotaxis sensor kinase CheA
MPRDPYKYYRIEARELIDGLAKGVLQLERAPASAEQGALLMRIAHTLKGAARVVKQAASAELAHRFEEILEPYRGGGDVAREHSEAMLRITDELRAELDALGSETPAAVAAVVAPASPEVTATVSPQRAAAPIVVEEHFQSVRVDLAEMDALLAGVSESVVQVSALQRHADELAQNRTTAASIIGLLTPEAGSNRGVPASALARARLLLTVNCRARWNVSIANCSKRPRPFRNRAAPGARTRRCAAPGAGRHGVRPARARCARRRALIVEQRHRVRQQRRRAASRRPRAVAARRCAAARGAQRGRSRHRVGLPNALRPASPRRAALSLRVERRGNRLLFRCS